MTRFLAVWWGVVCVPCFGGDGVVLDDLGEECGALAGSALEVVVVIDVKEAEARAKAFGPLEVIEQRPMEIASDIGFGVVDGVPDFAQVGDEEVLAEGVIKGAAVDPVFEDVDGALVALVGCLENIEKATRIKRPSKLRL